MAEILTTNGIKYDVNKLIALAEALPVIDVPTIDLAHHLDSKCWSDSVNDPERKQPNFSPRDVLLHYPEEPKYIYHYNKAMSSDLQFPIIMEGNTLIANGMHRLLKAHLANVPTIKAVIFDSLPEEARI